MQRIQKQRSLKPTGRFKTILGIAALALIAFPRPALAAADCNNNSPAELKKCLRDNPVVNDFQIVINFLSMGVAVVVVGVIVLGGIQYITAGDSAEKVSAAKQRIMNGLIALVIFIFTWAFLEWLLPGGVFR